MKKIKNNFKNFITLLILLLIFILGFVLFYIYKINVRPESNVVFSLSEKEYNFSSTFKAQLDSNARVEIPIYKEFEAHDYNNEIVVGNNLVNLIFTFERNLENYPVKTFLEHEINMLKNDDFYKDIDKEFIFQDTLIYNDIEISKVDYKSYYNNDIENNSNSIDFMSMYIIKIGSDIIKLECKFEDEENYNNYKDKIDYMVQNIEIIDDLKLEEYNKYLNQVEKNLKYNTLTEDQKELYNEIYKYFFVEGNDELKTDENINYFEVIDWLNWDLPYLGKDGYTITFLNEDMGEYDVLVKKYLSNNTIYAGTECVSGFKSKEEAEKYMQIAQEIIDEMPDNLTTYGKYKYLADKLIEKADYAYEELENERTTNEINNRIHEGAGVLLDGKSVCDGYAITYMYLCKKIGLFCEIVEINPTTTEDENWENSEGHAFNYILLNNTYYFVDITFLESDYYISEEDFAFIYVNDEANSHYKYLNPYVTKSNKNYVSIAPVYDDFVEKLATFNLYKLKYFN